MGWPCTLEQAYGYCLPCAKNSVKKAKPALGVHFSSVQSFQ